MRQYLPNKKAEALVVIKNYLGGLEVRGSFTHVNRKEDENVRRTPVTKM